MGAILDTILKRKLMVPRIDPMNPLWMGWARAGRSRLLDVEGAWPWAVLSLRRPSLSFIRDHPYRIE